MNYKVDTKDFKGPLDKLLTLVEDEELDISLISLAEVTNDFLSYLEELKDEDIPHRILADFLVVASKLLLIKSKIIIPSLDLEEDEEDIEDLELQLKLYKKIKEARSNIEENWREASVMSSREFLMTKETIFHPYPMLSIGDLRDNLESVVEEIRKLMPVEEVETEIVSLQSKIEDLLNKLADEVPAKLHNLKDGEGSKSELVALFLAVLHLFREELVDIEQDGNFGDISVRKKKSEQSS